MIDSTYVGLHVRKTAADPADPDAVWFSDHVTGAMSLKPFAGATFLDENSQPTDEAPEHIVLGADYVEREPWVELVGLKRVIAPAGPPDDPMRQTHNFAQADELVFHMLTGDYRYRVVGQPGRYQIAEDPGVEVRNYYLADLEAVEEPTGHDTSSGWRKISGAGRAAEFAPVKSTVEG